MTVDALQTLAILVNKLELIQPIIHFYRSFNKVKEACFSHDLHPDYIQILDDYWANLKDLNRTLGLSITPKIHISYFHVKKWCMDNKIGLGIHTEGPHESIHTRFDTIWERRKVRISNPRFPEVLRKSAAYLNSNAEIDY